MGVPNLPPFGSVMAMQQSLTIEERILYWLSLDTEVRRWLKGCSNGLR